MKGAIWEGLVETPFGEQKLWVVEDRYRRGGGLALQAWCWVEDKYLPEGGYHEPWGQLTVNQEAMPLKPNEVAVKVWSENEVWAEDCMAKMGWERTPWMVACGYAAAQIWRKP